MSEYMPTTGAVEIGYAERALRVNGTPHFAACLEFDRWLQSTLDEHAEKVLEGYARMVEKYIDPDMLWGPASITSDVRCWAEDGMTRDLLEEVETK